MDKELVFLNSRIPKELKKEIKKLAIDNGISVQDLAGKLLKLGINEFKKK